MKHIYKIVALSSLLGASLSLSAMKTSDIDRFEAGALANFINSRTEASRQAALSEYNRIKSEANRPVFKMRLDKINAKLSGAGLDINRAIVTRAPAPAPAGGIPDAPPLGAMPAPAAMPAGRGRDQIAELKRRRDAIEKAEADAKRAAQQPSNSQQIAIDHIQGMLQRLATIVDPTNRARQLKAIADRIVALQAELRAERKNEAAALLEAMLVEARRVQAEPQEDLAGDFTYLFAGTEEAEAKAAAQIEQEVQGLINNIRAAVKTGGSVTDLTNADVLLSVAAQRIANKTEEQTQRINAEIANLRAALKQARDTEAAAKTAADQRAQAERERQRLEQENREQERKDRAAREAAAAQAKAEQDAKDAAARAAAGAGVGARGDAWQALIQARGAFEANPDDTTSNTYEAAWNAVKNNPNVPDNAKDTVANAKATFGA